MSHTPSPSWRFFRAALPIALTSLGLASLANAEALPKAPAQDTTAATEAVRPTLDAGYFVLVSANAAERAQTLRRMGELRREIASQPGALAQRAEFAALVESLKQSAEDAARSAADEARAAGGKVGPIQAVVPGFSLQTQSVDLIEALKSRADVLDVQKVEWQLPSVATAMDANHHDGVGANALFVSGQPLTGSDIGIAVLDSGMDLDMNGTGRPHAAFYANGVAGDLSGGGIGGSRIQSSTLVHPDFYSITNPEDIHGHGTRITSTIAGAKWSAGLDVGHAPAWDADLYNFKISDDSILGAPATTLAMARALDAAVMQPEIQVANLSYDGHNVPNYFLNTEIDQTVQAGIVVTLAAGNHGADLSFAHAAYNGITVGASFEIAPLPTSFTAVGPLLTSVLGARRYPDLIAQGDQVSTAKIDNEGKFTLASGASLSAGFVAGTAALLLQADPTLTPRAVKALILQHASPLQGGPSPAGGLGYLQIKDAAEAAIAGEVIQTTTTVPTQSHLVTLPAGTPVEYTLVWERNISGPFGFGLTDLDLEVYDPSGQLVASSATPNDAAEQVSFTTAVAGTYRIDVLADFATGTTSSVDYALAGDEVGQCSSTSPQISAVSPSNIPAAVLPSEANIVNITGCGLNGITSVTIAGTSVPFGLVDNEHLNVQIPMLPIFGATMIDLNYNGGTVSTQVQADPVTPRLFGDDFMFNGVQANLTYMSQENDVVFMVGSFSNTPSSVPGIYDLAIGAANTDLTLLQVKGIPAGQAFDGFSFISPFCSSPFCPAGVQVFFQALVFDSVTGLVPLTATNVQLITTL